MIYSVENGSPLTVIITSTILSLLLAVREFIVVRRRVGVGRHGVGGAREGMLTFAYVPVQALRETLEPVGNVVFSAHPRHGERACLHPQPVTMATHTCNGNYGNTRGVNYSIVKTSATRIDSV